MDAQLRKKIQLRGGSFVKVEVDGHEDERIKFSPGGIIMTKGEKPDIFYWIMSGEVEIINGEGSSIATCVPGDFIGEIAFQRSIILGKKEAVRTATVIAKTEVVLVPISGNIFESLLGSSKTAPKIGLLRRLFIQAVKREDSLLEENDQLKQKVRDMQKQLDQFRVQIMNLRDKIKVLKSGE